MVVWEQSDSFLDRDRGGRDLDWDLDWDLDKEGWREVAYDERLFFAGVLPSDYFSLSSSLSQTRLPSFHSSFLSPPAHQSLHPSLSLTPPSGAAIMRRYSSEGSLLDMDFLPWRKVPVKGHNYHSRDGESGTYTPHLEDNELDGRTTSFPPTPTIVEPGASPGRTTRRGELRKDHSVSVENFTELGKLEGRGFLGVVNLNECRAYSDGQLVPGTTGRRTESVGSDDQPPPSPSYSPSGSSPLSFKSQQRSHTRAKLSAAKLHLKSLFGQSPHSSHSNLFNPEQKEQKEQKDSAKERRSRLPLMHQWSQVGNSNAKFSRVELDKWAESLDDLLASRTGVSVFGAFLRSEFSEENLQFYLACEQYRNSSNNFSLHKRAKAITATYIDAGAPREVNLDSKTRDLTTQLLQAPSHTSLSHAQKRIYSLLDTDCYPRFLQSTIYLTLLGQAD